MRWRRGTGAAASRPLACGERCPRSDGHHIEHWADGGETKLSNLALLCTRHHTRVHEGGWRICSDATGEQIVFFTPAGQALAAAPPLPALSPRDLLAESTRADPPAEGSSLTDALIARNVARGIRPDWRTNLPRCRHDHEIPWDVEAAAREAIDSGEEDDVA